MGQERTKTWLSSVNTRPSIASNADLNAKSEPITCDFEARIQEELKSLTNACDAYDNDGGRTAKELADAKLEVHRLLTELNAAERKLKELETKGSALDRFNNAVYQISGAFSKVLDLYTAAVQNSILKGFFGGNEVSIQAVDAGMKRNVRLHKRLTDLRKFAYVGQPFTRNVTADAVRAQADKIGNLFADLKSHIAADQSKEGK
jgi:oligoribonuclease NrnB/cAMP/cGMP phosphodiesterase (DHH superfamily)